MGQFKPMVKMETTEPSVELKLKKGGSVAHKKMKHGGESGHKPMKKMMDGGVMEALAAQPALVGGGAGPVAPVARTPKKPSMAERRMAMMKGMRRNKRAFKEGGESAAEHKKEKADIKKVQSELKAHEGKKASVAHKGLNKGGACYKDGGIIKSTSGKSTISTAEHTTKTSGKTGDVKYGNGGGYKTGGVVLGNGGGYKTGGVALGNAGGFKKGGSSKKAFANGGSVQNEGKAVSMPQGNKKPSTPVSISKLSGTFKKGGNVSSKALQAVFKKENAPALKAAKKDSNEVYSVYGGKKKDKHFVGGGHAEGNDSDNVSDLAYESVMKAEKSGKKTMIDPKEGSVTVKEREVTKAPAKKYPSGLTDEEISDFLTTNLMRRLYQHHIDKKDGGKVGK